MPTLYTHIDSNIRKTWAYITVFLLIVIAFGYFLSYYFGEPIILIIAVIFSLIMSLSSYWYSDKLVLSLVGAKEVGKDQAPELYRIVENLAITAGLPMPKVYIINEQAPNAFATGRDQEHAVVAVTAGLVNKLEKSELEGVIAHELSHIGNRDILLQTVLVVLAGFVVLASDFLLRSLIFGGGRRDRSSKGHPAIMIAGLVLIILAPIGVQLIKLAISRKREFLADADGALLTRYPEGLASALRKIAADPEPMRKGNRAMAHMYISPLKMAKYGRISTLFNTHPPVEQRINALLYINQNEK